jgi:hypothetical protein
MLLRRLLEFYTSYRGNVSAILRCGGCGCPHVGLTFAHGQLHSRRNSRGCVLVEFFRVPQTQFIAGFPSIFWQGSLQWPKAKDANVATEPY